MQVPSSMSDDRGETLLELLISIMILGVSVVAIVGGFASSIHMSDIHRKQSAAGAAAHNYAEKIAEFVASSGTPIPPATTSTGYVSCAPAGATSPYLPGPVQYSPPAGYTASVLSISYWKDTAFVPSCSPDQGAQLVTVQVESADHYASEKVAIVVRKPCRLTDAPC